VSGPVGGAAFHLTATSPVAENGGGILHTVSVNTAGTSGASVTLHDGTASGPVIAVIDATAVRSLTYDAVLAEGLTAVISGTPDVTVVILPPPGYTP
jgi:hypothetical protein